MNMWQWQPTPSLYWWNRFVLRMPFSWAPSLYSLQPLPPRRTTIEEDTTKVPKLTLSSSCSFLWASAHLPRWPRHNSLLWAALKTIDVDDFRSQSIFPSRSNETINFSLETGDPTNEWRSGQGGREGEKDRTNTTDGSMLWVAVKYLWIVEQWGISG